MDTCLEKLVTEFSYSIKDSRCLKISLFSYKKNNNGIFSVFFYFRYYKLSVTTKFSEIFILIQRYPYKL